MNVRQAKLQNTLSKIANRAIEITIISETRFTFSFDGKCDTATKAILGFFKGHSVSAEYDLECDFTCVYLEV